MWDSRARSNDSALRFGDGWTELDDDSDSLPANSLDADRLASSAADN